jgi:hypothetical protein
MAVMDLPGFSKWDIQKNYILFDFLVFRGTKPWLKVVSMTVSRLIGFHPAVLRSYRKLKRAVPMRFRKRPRE